MGRVYRLSCSLTPRAPYLRQRLHGPLGATRDGDPRRSRGRERLRRRSGQPCTGERADQLGDQGEGEDGDRGGDPTRLPEEHGDVDRGVDPEAGCGEDHRIPVRAPPGQPANGEEEQRRAEDDARPGSDAAWA